MRGDGSGELTAMGDKMDVQLAAPPGVGSSGRMHHIVVLADKVANWIEKGIEATVVLALVGELVVVFSNVVLRTLFGTSYDWVQDISQIALVFMTFVGGALTYRRGAHMRVHAGIQAIPTRFRPYVEAVVDAMVFVVALFLVQQSAELLVQQRLQRMPMLGWPVATMTAPVTIGVLLMAIFALGQLFSYPRRVAFLAAVVVAGAIGLLLASTANAVMPDQALLITLAAFAVLLAMSAPIGFVFATISFLYLQQSKLGMLTAVPLNMQYGASGFVMLAIPFFILAGLIMTEGGLAVPMSDAIACVVGRLRGGLLQVIVVTMYVFSGISGSKVADMVAVGSSLSVMLKREGYPKGETAAVLASAAAMGETVPPSVAMLVLSSVSTLSVASLFMAGLLPAALIALCLMVAIYLRAGKLGLHGAPGLPLRQVARKWVIAIPAFAMPVILVAGILSGVSTPTEVSSFAVVYGVAMAMLVYRKMDGRALWRVMGDSASMTGNILFIVSTATAFSWALTSAQVPNRLATLLNVFHDQPWLFMLGSIFLMVVMGALLEGLPMILVLGPILFPIAIQFGINSLQFGILMVIGMGVGLFSPPIGIGIYFACATAETTVEETLRPMLYYLAILVIGVLLVALLPEVSLALPRLAGMNIH